jgi:hypothetical protein
MENPYLGGLNYDQEQQLREILGRIIWRVVPNPAVCPQIQESLSLDRSGGAAAGNYRITAEVSSSKLTLRCNANNCGQRNCPIFKKQSEFLLE